MENYNILAPRFNDLSVPIKEIRQDLIEDKYKMLLGIKCTQIPWRKNKSRRFFC